MIDIEAVFDDSAATLILEGVSFASEDFDRPSGDPAFRLQAPLLLWLIRVTRPSTVIGLGLHEAQGYFTLCAAVLRLGLSAHAWGFGDWGGQPDGTAAVPPALRDRNARDFPGFSRLARLPDSAQALGRFPDGLFDLILLDAGQIPGQIPGQIAGDLADRISRAGSRRGVVVLQGAGTASGAALLAALGARHPVISFDECGGLALILTGSAPVPALAFLARQAKAAAALRHCLVRLGQGGAEAARLQMEDHILRLTTACEAAVNDRDEARAEARLAARDLAERPLANSNPANSDPAPPAADSAEVEAVRAELAAARQGLEDGQALRLRETRVLTGELERLTEELRMARATAPMVQAGQEAAAEMQAALQTARAELSALRIRHFDAVEDLQGEVAWFTRELEAARVAAEARLAEQARTLTETVTETLTGTHQAATAAQAAAHAAELARLSAQIAAQVRAETRLKAQLDRQKAEAAGRDQERQAQLKLRDWQLAWLSTSKSRFGKRMGPSGGSLADEIAAVAQNPLFDASWYLETYPDVKAGGMAAAEHFLHHGLFEGRNPGPRFQTLPWFVAHPDALTGWRNPLLDADPAAPGKTRATAQRRP